MNDNMAFANREVCDVILRSFSTKKVVAFIPFANATAVELTGDETYAYGGKGHPRRITYSGDRGGSLTISTQLMTAKLYEILTGTTAATSASFMKRKVITCETAGQLTLPAAWTNVEVFANTDDCGTEIEGTMSTTTFSATTATELAVDTKYIVYGIESISTGVKNIQITSKTFPSAFEISAYTYNKTESGEVVPYRLKAFKCQPESQFSISFSNSGDPASLDIKFTLMADSDNNMLEMQILDPTSNTTDL